MPIGIAGPLGPAPACGAEVKAEAGSRVPHAVAARSSTARSRAQRLLRAVAPLRRIPRTGFVATPDPFPGSRAPTRRAASVHAERPSGGDGRARGHEGAARLPAGPLTARRAGAPVLRALVNR